MKLPNGPVWHSAGGLMRAQMPAPLRRWLLGASSLTQRVERICPRGVTLRLLGQAWAPVPADEAQRLRLGSGRDAFVRRVQLLCGSTPWVFGRTVIPVRTLRGRGRRLTHLGTLPLGTVLFADHSLRRESLEVARLTREHALFREALGDPEGTAAVAWARRSRYVLAGRPLLVTEVFLPAMDRAAPPEPPARSLGKRNGNHHG